MSDESKGAVSPERIWLQSDPEEFGHHEVTWCNARQAATDTEYVRADLLAAAEARVAEAEAYIGTLLEGDPDVVRVCEGGGMEEVLSSLAVTMHKTRDRRDRLAAANAELQAEIDRINDAQAASLGAEICRLTAANAAQAREIERLQTAIRRASLMGNPDNIRRELRAALAPAADASGEVTP